MPSSVGEESQIEALLHHAPLIRDGPIVVSARANYRVTGQFCSFIKAHGPGKTGEPRRNGVTSLAQPSPPSPPAASLVDMLTLMGSDSVIPAHNRKKIVQLSNDLGVAASAGSHPKRNWQPTSSAALTGRPLGT